MKKQVNLIKNVFKTYQECIILFLSSFRIRQNLVGISRVGSSALLLTNKIYGVEGKGKSTRYFPKKDVIKSS